MDTILKTISLTKKINKINVINNLNLSVEKGAIYGFVGQNGAGKTTVMRIICGIIDPTEGELELFNVSYKNKKIYNVRKNISAIIESPSVFQNFTAIKNLKLQFSLLGLKYSKDKLIDILTTVGLKEVISSNKIAKNFSLGMRQRLGIAMALVGNPQLILLDEPTNGLDPSGIAELRNLILELNKTKKITFFISSHNLDELSKIATCYGFLKQGKLICEITKEEILGKLTSQVIIESDNNDLLIKLLETENYIAKKNNNKIIISSNINFNDFLITLTKLTQKNNIIIFSISKKDFDLEKYYLNLLNTGEKNDIN